MDNVLFSPPYRRVGGHIVFGTDPVGVGVSVSNENSGFLTFGVISLCFVRKIFRVLSVTQIPFGIF